MKKVEKISNIGFVGIAIWFPVMFVFLFLAEKNILSTNTMEMIGVIAAVFIFIFIVTLWICSVVRLIKGWKDRTDSLNMIYLLLLLLGTIIGSMIFHVLETTAVKSNKTNAPTVSLTCKGNKFVKYILIGSVLFFPLGLLAGITANFDGKAFELISFSAAILTIIPYLCLFAIWFIGICRLIINWRIRALTLNVAYSMLIFFLPLIGGIIFCFINEPNYTETE